MELALALLYFVGRSLAPRCPNAEKRSTYACGERADPLRAPLNLSYCRYLAFFAALEISPVLAAVCLLLGVDLRILAAYLLVLALMIVLVAVRR